VSKQGLPPMAGFRVSPMVCPRGIAGEQRGGLDFPPWLLEAAISSRRGADGTIPGAIQGHEAQYMKHSRGCFRP
jgi:hypothetical protein